MVIINTVNDTIVNAECKDIKAVEAVFKPFFDAENIEKKKVE